MRLIGKTAEVRLRVSPPDVAESRLSPWEGFPAVLVDLMELAASRLIRPQLGEGQSSVSVEMNLTHLVAASPGELRTVAMYLGANGRLHHFRVHAFDETGLIGCAEHTRAVAVSRRLLATARRRAGRPAMLLNV